MHKSVRPLQRLAILMASGALCACSGPRLSPTSVTPQQLLAANRRVTGAFTARGTFHFQYRTIASDGDVSVSDEYQAGAGSTNYRLTNVHAGTRTARGRNSGRLWLQDANGLVVADSALGTVFDRVLAAAAHKPDP